MVLGCGGRDPLYGVDNGGTTPPPVSGTGGGTNPNPNPGTGGTPGTTIPPMPAPDASIPPPPLPRDAGARDAAPPMTGMCPFPKCLAAVMFDCTPTGMCVQQRTSGGGGLGNNVCYGNGVKLVTSLSGGGRNPTAAIKVFKADGTLCYTVEPEQRGGGVNAIAYRDASGQQIASATVDRNSLAIACAGTTTPVSVPMSCQPGLQGSTGSCRNGMCM
ncbi:MAG TPA: hypothetical protein VN914_01325 [Polyangia bacterium]|nr:hypothetical protein [Polyangia bacterium]